ncbi:MAG: aminotransferase class I/II-fold pyridoxal phosphate-dependent enzyme [Solirubrobacterales bacterium]|nr:aminotransferase class I/II-fold pyridoxal phosphate-dependent enzyme [Solirubrobacterales bacterium]
MPPDQYDLTNISLERLRLRRSAKWTSFPPDVLPAFVAEMDFPLAGPVKQALIEAIELDDTGYANAPDSGLADAFADFAFRNWNWRVDPGQVTATSDVVGGLRALLDLVTGPLEGVVINPPVYFPFFSIVPEVGSELIEVPLREDGGLDLPAVENAFREGARAMILCSPHNPAGTVPSRSELERIAEVAAEYDAWVLADEIHAPLTLPGAEHVPFLEVSDAARECGICVTSASKAFNIAGLGCAVIVTASERAARIVSRLPAGATHPGHLGVIASIAAFREGENWLREVLGQLDANRRILAGLLAEHLPAAKYRAPAAGYLAWVDARETGLGPDPSIPILDEARVAVSSGPGFGRSGAGYFRLNIGTSPDLIEAAVRSIAEIA